MEKLSIKIHPVFIMLGFVLVYFGWLAQFVTYFVALVLHELAHYGVAKYYGYNLNKIIFMPYGAGLGGTRQIINPKHEIFIALAGPIINIVLIVVCVACWWMWPQTYMYTNFFVYCNLALALFNLLPVFPLDGGRVIVCFFKQVNRLLAYKIMKITGIVFSIIFAGLFVFSVFTSLNLTYFFISVFLFTSCFNNNSNIYFERSNTIANQNNLNSVKAVKSFVVSSKTPMYKLLKHIGSGGYAMFYIVENNKIVKILTEQELLSKINKI